MLIAALSFTLGRYSIEFSGSVLAWTAVVCSIFAGSVNLYLLIKDFLESRWPDALRAPRVRERAPGST